MFNNFFSRQAVAQSAPEKTPVSHEVSYVEVAGLMDDFMSLEEVAPGAEWSDVLAASWGIPCETGTTETKPSVNFKASTIRVFRSWWQASRTKLEVA